MTFNNFFQIKVSDILNRIELFKILKLAFISTKLPCQLSDEWFKLRSNKITASTMYFFNNPEFTLFGKNSDSILEDKINPENKKIIYNSDIIRGIIFEKVVCQYLQKINNLIIFPSGLFLHDEYPFIAGSPDGFYINFDDMSGGCIEIKCPRNFCKLYDQYIDQMQTQMHVTKLHHCSFVSCVFNFVSRFNFLNIDTVPKGYLIYRHPDFDYDDILNLEHIDPAFICYPNKFFNIGDASDDINLLPTSGNIIYFLISNYYIKNINKNYSFIDDNINTIIDLLKSKAPHILLQNIIDKK